MKYQNIILLISCFLFFLQCKNNCEVTEKYHENDNPKIINYFENCRNKSEYKSSIFYESGQIQNEGFYKDGKKHGIFKRWNRNGILIESWKMKNGKTNGKVTCWYDDGTLKRKLNVKNEKKNGSFVEWDSLGELIVKGTYQNDLRQNLWKYYISPGSWMERTYLNDTLNGTTFEYIIDSLNNVEHILGQYLDGQEDGIWKWFDNDSILYKTRTYKNGEFNGKFKNFYKNGIIQSEGIIKNGKYFGEIKNYDKLGKLKEKSR
jgi:antitoxin component YwqK of YwqJK toxin-antitoxin module